MELSAELFKQTLAALKSDHFVGGKEKRSAPRVQIKSKIRILVHAGNRTIATQSVMLNNISQGGICIEYDHPMLPESKFIVQLPSRHNTPLTMLCSAKNMRVLRPKVWAIGSTFTEVLAGTPETWLLPEIPKGKSGEVFLTDQSAEFIDAKKITEHHTDDELIKRIQAAMFD